MKINDLEFSEFITEEKALKKVRLLAEQINADYENRIPIFLPVLNGSFMFAADLIKMISIRCQISFVKVASYEGTSSTGNLKTLLGFDESLAGKDVIIVEDIVDTGFTLLKLYDELDKMGTRSVETVTLLRKTPAREKGIKVKYVGFDIDDEFVLGYGLDYNGLGRNYKDIYKAGVKS